MENKIILKIKSGTFSTYEVQVNTFRKDSFYEAEILEVERLTSEDAESDTRKIIIKAPDYKYLEGQSAGILPPGFMDNGKPNKVRLYSIASLGNLNDASIETVELCVKRVEYKDEAGELMKGICSNYLCDLKAGDKIKLTGPAGRKFLLPIAEETKRPFFFLSTGTGIAPFKPMIERLISTANFNSAIYLFAGYKYSNEVLYDEFFKSIDYKNFHYFTTISREQKAKDGNRKYVHHLMQENATSIITDLEASNSLIYICGLKGMEENILETIVEIINEHGSDSNISEKEITLLKEVY